MLFEIEPTLTIEPCVSVDRETVFFTVLPPRPEPCAGSADMGTLFGTELPLATDPGTDAGDCEAPFVVKSTRSN